MIIECLSEDRNLNRDVGGEKKPALCEAARGTGERGAALCAHPSLALGHFTLTHPSALNSNATSWRPLP